MIQLVYISAATADFSDDDLVELLAKARVKNLALGITGMLLFHEGSFIQVLEGETQAVDALYAKISADPRHGEARILVRRELEERSFGDWSMGFYRTSEHLHEHPAGLSQFLDFGFNDVSVDLGGQAQRALLAFREGRWRSQVDC